MSRRFRAEGALPQAPLPAPPRAAEPLPDPSDWTFISSTNGVAPSASRTARATTWAPSPWSTPWRARQSRNAPTSTTSTSTTDACGSRSPAERAPSRP